MTPVEAEARAYIEVAREREPLLYTPPPSYQYLIDMLAVIDGLRGEIAVLNATKPDGTQEARAAAIEECARFVERGSFLHDDAPGARFARECAAAMRRDLLALLAVPR